MQASDWQAFGQSILYAMKEAYDRDKRDIKLTLDAPSKVVPKIVSSTKNTNKTEKSTGGIHANKYNKSVKLEKGATHLTPTKAV